MSTTLNVGELLNLVGLSTGVVLYAMLLAMVIRADRTATLQARFDPLLLLTSLLGLAWNLCALPAYELPKMGIAGPFPALSAVGFGALGFLPAVVVHSVLRDDRQRIPGAAQRLLTTLAYVVSGVAAALQVGAAWTGAPVPSPFAMRLLTYSFVALALPLAALTRRRPGAGRALWAAALAIFAVSALHLSQLHRGEASWPVELVGHHASLPLAFAILYQDYRFALADLFLKRAMALLAIVAVAFAAIATIGVRSPAFARFVEVDPREMTLLVTLWLATALLYPRLRRATSRFVDTIVLRRPDYALVRAAVARAAQNSDTVEAVLEMACTRVAAAFNAGFVTWRAWAPAPHDGTLGAIVVRGPGGAEIEAAIAGDPLPGAAAAWVTVPTSEATQFAIAIGALAGGRRLLSDDLALLEAIGLVVARRIDAIRITDERYDRGRREQEIARLATEAELRALRAQLNPHFLFNALTTIGYLIQTAPPRALETLLRLTTLLRGVLRTEGELTTLGRELELVESYLEIEKARFEDRLRVSIDVPDRLRTISLPPLLLQPLVENAVKHGIAPKQSGGDVSIHASVDGLGDQRRLVITVADTGAGATSGRVAQGREAGLGLRAVERRLECQYGTAASFSMKTTIDEGTRVVIRLPVAVAATAGDRVAAARP